MSLNVAKKTTSVALPAAAPAKSAAAASPVVSKDKDAETPWQMLEQSAKDLAKIGFNININGVKRENTQEALFDCARRLFLPRVGDTVLKENWRTHHQQNMDLLQQAAKKIDTLPPDIKKEVYAIARMAPLLYRMDPEAYTQELLGVFDTPTDHTARQKIAVRLQRDSTLLSQRQLLPKAAPYINMGAITTSDVVKSVSPTTPLPKKLTSIKSILDVQQKATEAKTAQRPLMLMLWNSREGPVRRFSNQSSKENEQLTTALKEYYENQHNLRILPVDVSKSGLNGTLNVQGLFDTFAPSGIFVGGGPVPTAKSAFVSNLKPLLQEAQKRKIPFLGEGLGMQLIAQALSDHQGTYNDFVKPLKLHKHRDRYVSVVNIEDLVKDANHYPQALKDFLSQHGLDPNTKKYQIKTYCLHNNMLDKDKLPKNIKISAHVDNHVPEVLTLTTDNNTKKVVGTQFHASHLLQYQPKFDARDHLFSRALLQSFVQEVLRRFELDRSTKETKQ